MAEWEKDRMLPLFFLVQELKSSTTSHEAVQYIGDEFCDKQQEWWTVSDRFAILVDKSNSYFAWKS